MMYKEIIKSIQNDYKFLILYSFLIILAYGFHMFNLTLFGDDLLAFQLKNFQYDFVVSIGRWMQRIIWMLFDNDFFVPVLSLSILLFSFYISIKIIFLSLKIKFNILFYMFTIIFSFSPILIEQITFIEGHINLAIGFLFASFACYNFVKYIDVNKIKYFIFSVIYLSLAISCKQVIAPFIIQFLAIYIIFDIISNRQEFKNYV